MSTPIAVIFSTVWYVCSINGIDAAGTAGTNRARPLKTLAQAYTNASANDIICCLSGHAEVLTATQVFAKSIMLVGQGTNGGLPAVTFQLNAAGNPFLFQVTAAGCEIRNIHFLSAAQASSGATVVVQSTAFRMLECYFERGASDTGPGLAITNNSNFARILDTTFVSTASLTTAQPESGIKVTGTITDLELDGVVFSGGAAGWSNFYAGQLNQSITRLKATSISQLLGADAIVGAASSGWWNTQASSGGARLDW